MDGPPRSEAGAGAASERNDRETEAARRDFHRAAEAERPRGRGAPRAGRHGAMQAFLLANTGRGLLPGNETSGAVTPPLKDEEA